MNPAAGAFPPVRSNHPRRGLWPSAASPPCPSRKTLRRVSRQDELDAIPSSGSDVAPRLSPRGAPSDRRMSLNDLSSEHVAVQVDLLNI